MSGVEAPDYREEATSPILLWCEHTASIARPTGVQRVVRSLAREFGSAARLVGWDGWRRTLRPLSPVETRALGRTDVVPKDRSVRGGWLLFAETPAGAIAAGVDPVELAHALGLRAAVLVHDLIPVLAPERYAPETVVFYRSYLGCLARADLVFVTTHCVAAQLRSFLEAEGSSVPTVIVAPLAAELPGMPRVVEAPPIRAHGTRLDLLTVSRWEPRKNLPLLLRTIRRVRDEGRGRGRDVRLTMVGRRGGFPEHEALLDAMLADMPWVSAPKETRDPELPALYARHHAALYPSLDEGFGLPILESLWCGRPCLHHDSSAMAEVGPGGGTLALDMTDEAALAETLVRLYDDPQTLAGLAAQAVRRPLRQWADVAADVRFALSSA